MKKAAWLHPLASRLDDLPKTRPTFDKAAKQVRNRLRPFSVLSIARHAMIFLHRESGKPRLEEMSTWPWVTLLIVKLALEEKSIAIDRGTECTPEVFDKCRQTIWDSQGASERKEMSPGGTYLMLRAMLQAQLPFQRKISWDFIRWPALIARLSPDHPSRQLFVTRMNMEPDTFLCLCYAAFVPVLNGSHSMTLREFSPLRRRFGTDVDQFFNDFARDLTGLRAELLRERGIQIANQGNTRPHQHLHEFPWLSNYPLLRVPGDRFEIWHPAVFARGMEQAVHKRLSERREEYTRHFSKVFESYVLELLSEAGVTYLGEAEYQRVVGTHMKAVEAIVTADGSNVFIESKLTSYSEDILTSNRSPRVWQGLKRVREAMQQAWLVGDQLRSGSAPDWKCVRASDDYLLVVTSQPVACATGEHFRHMFKHGVFDPATLASQSIKVPTDVHLNRLPLKNVIVASIDEFEHLMDGVKDGNIELVPFLREVASGNLSPATSVMFLGQAIAHKASRRSPPDVIARARDWAEQTLGTLVEDTSP